MVKRFSKFLKFKNNTNFGFARNTRTNRRKGKFVVAPTFYECGKVGHIKPECPVIKMKQKMEEKNNQDNINCYQ